MSAWWVAPVAFAFAGSLLALALALALLALVLRVQLPRLAEPLILELKRALENALITSDPDPIFSEIGKADINLRPVKETHDRVTACLSIDPPEKHGCVAWDYIQQTDVAKRDCGQLTWRLPWGCALKGMTVLGPPDAAITSVVIGGKEVFRQPPSPLRLIGENSRWEQSFDWPGLQAKTGVTITIDRTVCDVCGATRAQCNALDVRCCQYCDHKDKVQ